ncbi:transcriptional regulator CynR [Erwinia aphidicola]|uniref:transcriptional regulator CynR n=1 Tax=Erwinia aphidicola TaxID=68334 RepID=UPI0030CC519E
MLLRHIHYFLAVAEHGSFTRAASALYVSQPALSQQIKQLEETLGAILFDRSGRTVRLTDAGEVYARYAQQALRKLSAGERAIHDVDNLSRGALRIAINPTFTGYLLGPLVARFHQQYPSITLAIREMPQEQMQQDLLADRLDLALGFADGVQADIDAQPLLSETLALVVARHHPLAIESQIGLSALNDLHLVLLTPEYATREQIDYYCRQHQLRPKVQMEASSVSAVVEIVRRTQLATLLPAKIARENGELKAVALSPSLLERTAVLLQRKGGYQTAAARAFIDLARLSFAS